MPLDGSPGDGARLASQSPDAERGVGRARADEPPGDLAVTQLAVPVGLQPAATGSAEGAPGYRTAGLIGLIRRSDWVTWLTASGVFVAYCLISIYRYLRRDPTSWDLGIFTEYVKDFAQFRAPIVNIKGPGFNLLGDHFHPIVALIAPFFSFFPTPVTLLVAQALLAAISVFPVYRAAADLLGVGAGRAISVAYGFSWGLQQMANYDFHEIAFAVPLLAFSLSALVRGRVRAAVLWALPLVLVKEDQGLTLAVLGLIMVFSYGHREAGLFVTAWGTFWSLLAIFVIIPHFNASHTYPYWSASQVSPVGGHVTAGGLWDALANGAATKLPTLALILLPTAFIALRSPLILAAVPSLLLRFINTSPSYWGTDWHYNATVMPIMFLAAIDAMARIRARRVAGARQERPDLDGSAGQLTAPELAQAWIPGPVSRLGRTAEHYGAAAMLSICAALVFQFPVSSLWTPGTYSLGPHVAAENAAMAMVPAGATVATDLDLVAPLAAKADTYWLGNYADNPPTQYVVFDNQSTDFPPQANVLSYVQALIKNTRYRQIYARDGVYVFVRASR